MAREKINLLQKKKQIWQRVLAVLLILVIEILGLQAPAQIIPFAFWNSQTPLFTWLGGAKLQTMAGIYGTKGTGSTVNHPGERSGSANWTDSSGNFWLFGGYGYDQNGGLCVLSDLWEYTTANNEWTWVGGWPDACQGGLYGTEGTGSTSNIPGSRSNASSWVDASGNFWLFGGDGLDVNSNWYNLSDLWEYVPSSGKWTWVSGPSTGNLDGVYGTKGTGSTSNFPGGRSAATAWSDSSANIWIFGGFGLDISGNQNRLNDFWEYIPGTKKWIWVGGSSSVAGGPTNGTKGSGATTNIPGATSDASGWIDASGNLWMFGGNAFDGTNTGPVNDLWEYTPSSSKWTWVGGASTVGGAATYGVQGTGATTNIPSGRMDFASAKDSSGVFWIFGGYGLDKNGVTGALQEVWSFNPTTKNWTWMAGSQLSSQGGVYGTQGTASVSNIVSGRQNPMAWADSSGNLWIFGGETHPPVSSPTYLNDLWRYTPAGGTWAWMSGPSVNLQNPNYGVIGIANSSNFPGARIQLLTWADSLGNFWMMGGTVIDSTGTEGFNNDLWKYTPTTPAWLWVSGSSTVIPSGTYGTKGTGSASNAPGGRGSSNTWADSSGNLWLFGGIGADSTGSVGDLSDLWKYTISSNQWTWMAGPNTGSALPTYGTKGTGSISNIPGARDSGVSFKDASGNLWLFGGTAKDVSGNVDYANDLWKYAPASGQWTWMSGSNTQDQSGTYGTKGVGSTSNTPGARNTAVSWTDGSGNLWLFGGLGLDSNGTGGFLNDLWMYSPSSGQWTWKSGSNTVNSNGVYGTLKIPSASTVPGARQDAISWTDSSGNLWMIGGSGYDSAGNNDLLSDVWKYIPATNQWTWVAGSNLVLQSGAYGTLGLSAQSNIPGSRIFAGAWTDGKNNAWIFGGQGLDGSGNFGYLNDFWKFSP